MRILITGGSGQLASDLLAVFPDDETVAPDHAELDITDIHAVETRLHKLHPDVVINTAAFHRVDLCETEPEQSFAVNAAAPQRLAALCRRHDALLVHFSTDYVFDGSARQPYAETSPVNPLSVYGASKAAGEMALRCTTDRHLIIRTTGLYGHAGERTAGGNFVETMLRLAATDKPISVVADQVLTPTYTRDLAQAVRDLIELGARGTFHLTNGGQCSWYEFAAEIFRLAGVSPEVKPTTQLERPVPARRPAYSVLAHDAMLRAGLPEMRPWQQAVRDYVSGRAQEAGTA